MIKDSLSNESLVILNSVKKVKDRIRFLDQAEVNQIHYIALEYYRTENVRVASAFLRWIVTFEELESSIRNDVYRLLEELYESTALSDVSGKYGSAFQIGDHVVPDFNDDFNLSEIDYDPYLSTEFWDLRTLNNQEIAPGLYIYTVHAQGIKHISKFAVVR